MMHQKQQNMLNLLTVKFQAVVLACWRYGIASRHGEDVPSEAEISEEGTKYAQMYKRYWLGAWNYNENRKNW